MKALGQTPITVELGTWRTPKGPDFALRMVVRRSLLTDIVGRAMRSVDGRATLGGGLITILAKRLPPTPLNAVAAEARCAP
jgi:hypothetical protein